MPNYFEFEVSLQRIKPRIWRRFQLRGTSTFADLHWAIQDSFGWENYHLWEFRAPGRRGRLLAGVPDDEENLWFDPERTPDAESVKLARDFKTKGASARCQYTYDFGDNWIHTVKLRQRLSSPERFSRRLLAGRRACPQEDSGGVTGYGRLVEFKETGSDPWDDAENLGEWMGDWDPARFDPAAARIAFDK